LRKINLNVAGAATAALNNMLLGPMPMDNPSLFFQA